MEDGQEGVTSCSSGVASWLVAYHIADIRVGGFLAMVGYRVLDRPKSAFGLTTGRKLPVP
jgi:hypothetical protein